LPNARLNPLLNPLLAKQLGRWAHIYYTASVEKREAAIEKLVCELEAEEARQTGSVPSPVASLNEPFQPGPVASRNTGPVLVTPQRAEPLPPELRAVESLWSRTAVGEPPPLEPAFQPPVAEQPVFDRPVFDSPVFHPPVSQLPVFEPPVFEPPVFPPLAEESQFRQQEAFATPVPHAPLETAEQIEVTPGPAIESWQGLLRRTGSAPPEDRWQPPPATGAEVATNASVAGVSKEDRVSTQNSRSFDDLLAQSEPTHFPAPATRSLRGAWIAAALLVVFGGSVWIAQNHRFHSAAPERAVASEKPVAPTIATEPSAAPTASSRAAIRIPPIPVPATPAPGIAAATQSTARPDIASRAADPAPPVQQSQSADANQPTDPELLAGMRALQGNGLQRNSAEAARHLWLSVKNQNGSALILLAGLYAQGDGVAKDCDQAKILLNAAGRQAKSHSQLQRVEATRATLRTSGCE
jgi:hypothetical protein